MVTATMPLPLIFVLKYNVCLPQTHRHTRAKMCQNTTGAQQVANSLMKCHHIVISVFVTEHTKPTLSN